MKKGLIALIVVVVVVVVIILATGGDEAPAGPGVQAPVTAPGDELSPEMQQLKQADLAAQQEAIRRSREADGDLP